MLAPVPTPKPTPTIPTQSPTKLTLQMVADRLVRDTHISSLEAHFEAQKIYQQEERAIHMKLATQPTPIPHASNLAMNILANLRKHPNMVLLRSTNAAAKANAESSKDDDDDALSDDIKVGSDVSDEDDYEEIDAQMLEQEPRFSRRSNGCRGTELPTVVAQMVAADASPGC